MTGSVINLTAQEVLDSDESEVQEKLHALAGVVLAAAEAILDGVYQQDLYTEDEVYATVALIVRVLQRAADHLGLAP